MAAHIRSELLRIAEDVQTPDGIGSKTAAAAVAALNAALRSLTVEQDLRERETLEPRIKAIEEARGWR